MGLLRLLLAIAVLLQHTRGCSYTMTGGAASVQTFYIISGFLIAMILDVKYKEPEQRWLFYSNRALRIFGTYWLFLLVAILIQWTGHVVDHRSVFDIWGQNRSRLGHIGPWFLALSNLLIIGQDLTLFLALGGHGLHWTTDFWRSTPIVPAFMLIAPAWSLSLELMFYVLAPWILRWRTRWLILLIALSLILRLFLWYAGLRTDPWSYRFFPNEIALFLAGALSYRLIYSRLRSQAPSLASKLLGSAIIPAVVLFPFYDHSHGTFFSPSKILYFFYVTCAIPFLFRWTGAIALDRQLGDLSYPLYLCHFNFVEALNHTATRFGVMSRAVLGIVISCFVAYLSCLLWDRPLDRFRQSRIGKTRASSGNLPQTVRNDLVVVDRELGSVASPDAQGDVESA